MRADWDYCWWKHIMESLQDVPSKIPFEEQAFEKWRPYIEPPFCDRANVVIALDGLEIAGILVFGPPIEQTININHTSVSRGYRRRGISIALKVAAIQRIQTKGIRWIGTQNHQSNHMYEINQAFGFRNIDTQTEWTKSL